MPFGICIVNKNQGIFFPIVKFGFLLSLVISGAVNADVAIIRGKTIIPAGNAISAQDITVRNGKLAFSIAVDSAPPWGVARGCIVDIANVLADGSLSSDRVAFADFIPNNWSSWPTTYKQVNVVKDSPEEVIIQSTRDFGDVAIETFYSLKSGSDLIHVTTTMKNNGEDLNQLVSGFTLWPDGGYKFSVPGYAGIDNTLIQDPIADRFVGYDHDWAIALHAPYATELKNKSRDLYTRHSLKRGESISFEGDYQVISSGNLARVVQAEIERKHLNYGTLFGTVSAVGGEPVDAPAVVVEKSGIPYIWVVGSKGEYSIDLPVGEYEIYASGKGYSDSDRHKVKISSTKKIEKSFYGLQPPGTVNVFITDANSAKPLDAKIQIEKGNKPLIEFFGSKTFFTELEEVGKTSFELAPGKYQLKVSYGENFLAASAYIDVMVQANKSVVVKSGIEIKTYPAAQGWYTGDLHHHADVLEGSTSPEYVVRSQLAAGLDLTFLSDHDSSKNHQLMQSLSAKRGRIFIPSMEISASWGHFNAFPIEINASLSVDPGVDDIHMILEDARKMGAIAVASNHPYIPYGYLNSLEKGTAPGGFNPTIDLLEINSEVDNKKVIAKARALWSEGLPYYYTAGSDTHDVWNETTGHNRMFVYTGSKPTAKSFTQAMKNGRSYVSFGPVIYPQNVMFGDTLKLAADQKQHITFELLSVNGLKSVKLMSSKGIEKEIMLAGEKQTINFDVPHRNGWLALVVEDSNSNKAYSNPVWLKTLTKEQF